jgi:glycosyltransferase involved in cell wall biosynthesis
MTAPVCVVIEDSLLLPYRILAIAPTSFFADYGAHVRIYEEVRHLQERGHRVTICTYHNGDAVPGMDIRRSLNVPWRQGVQVGSTRHKLYFDVMLEWTVLRAALRTRPHLIHAHMYEGALLGWPLRQLLGVPLVFDYQGSLSGEMIDHHFLRRDGTFYPAVRGLESWINGLPDAIITSSENGAAALRDTFQVPPERVFPITDGVNTSVFAPPGTAAARETVAARKALLGIPPEAKVVVYLGVLAPYQGTDLLLEAARTVLQTQPDTYFVIMGYPGAESYARLAGEMGLLHRVLFPGRIPYAEAPAWLSVGDVAVAPKLSATEGAGKIGNYMALGLPTVAFDTPVSREFLGDLGLYAERGNAVALAGALDSILDDDARRPRLGAALRDRAVRCYSWQAAVRRIEDVYAVARRWRGGAQPAPVPPPLRSARQ